MTGTTFYVFFTFCVCLVALTCVGLSLLLLVRCCAPSFGPDQALALVQEMKERGLKLSAAAHRVTLTSVADGEGHGAAMILLDKMKVRYAGMYTSTIVKAHRSKLKQTST